MAHPPTDDVAADGLDVLYAELPTHHYEPLWTMSGALTPEPTTRMVPFLWRYADVRDYLLRAGALISAEEADRRVLAMRNPGTADGEIARATDTLWAAMQLVLPGENAPPHRHTASALRLIIEGSGGFTVVDGRRVNMHEGDFLVTPSWSWHEHGHDGAGPMLWLDGLDLPLIHRLHAGFADFDGDAIARRSVPSAARRSGALRPRWHGAPDAPTVVWPFEDVEAALDELRDEPGSPYDDLVIEYQDPSTNGSVMATMAAEMQLLRAGVTTKAHRHTDSVVYHVVRGEGVSTLDGEPVVWSRGDTFAVPAWVEHAHSNPRSDDALLFSFSDRPALERLGVWVQRPSEEPGT